MVPISHFHPHVMPYAAGASEMLIDQYLISAAIDFCSGSLIVQADLDPMTLIPGIVEYELDSPGQQKIHMLMHVYHGARELGIVTADMAQANPAHYGNWFYAGATVPTGRPNQIFQKNEKTFLVDRAPDELEPIILTLSAALKPDRKATQLADILFDDYADAIALGAASRLLMLPNQAFSNPQLAAAYGIQFAQQRAAAQLRAATSFGRATHRVRIPKI